MLPDGPYREIEPVTHPVAYAFPGQGTYDLKVIPYLLGNSSRAKAMFVQAQDILGKQFTDNLLAANSEELQIEGRLQAGIVLANLLMFHAALQKNDALANNLPQLYVGHSLGEWSAYIASGAVSLEDALPALVVRELLMRKVPGKMVRLLNKNENDEDDIRRYCYGSGVAITLVNRPDYFVVGGNPRMVDNFLKNHGLENEDMNVPVLAHHEDLRDVAREFTLYLANNVHFQNPDRPVLVNAGNYLVYDSANLRNAASDQFVMAVDVRSIGRVMKREGVIAIAEFGTKRVLSALLNEDFKTINFTNSRSLQKPVTVDFLL